MLLLDLNPAHHSTILAALNHRLYGMIHSQFRDVLTGLLVSGLEKPKPPELSALIATQPYDYEAEDSE